LFFKNEVYLTYYMMYDSDASIKSPGILYYSILFTVFQLFAKQKKEAAAPRQLRFLFMPFTGLP